MSHELMTSVIGGSPPFPMIPPSLSTIKPRENGARGFNGASIAPIRRGPESGESQPQRKTQICSTRG